MKLQEACERLNKLVGIKFKDLFSPEDMKNGYVLKYSIVLCQEKSLHLFFA